MEPQVELRQLARELASYEIDELNAVALKLQTIAGMLDAADKLSNIEAYKEGIRIGRESMKSEMQAKMIPVFPTGRVIRRLDGKKVRA